MMIQRPCHPLVTGLLCLLMLTACENKPAPDMPHESSILEAFNATPSDPEHSYEDTVRQERLDAALELGKSSRIQDYTLFGIIGRVVPLNPHGNYLSFIDMYAFDDALFIAMADQSHKVSIKKYTLDTGSIDTVSDVPYPKYEWDAYASPTELWIRTWGWPLPYSYAYTRVYGRGPVPAPRNVPPKDSIWTISTWSIEADGQGSMGNSPLLHINGDLGLLAQDNYLYTLNKNQQTQSYQQNQSIQLPASIKAVQLFRNQELDHEAIVLLSSGNLIKVGINSKGLFIDKNHQVLGNISLNPSAEVSIRLSQNRIWVSQVLRNGAIIQTLARNQDSPGPPINVSLPIVLGTRSELIEARGGNLYNRAGEVQLVDRLPAQDLLYEEFWAPGAIKPHRETRGLEPKARISHTTFYPWDSDLNAGYREQIAQAISTRGFGKEGQGWAGFYPNSLAVKVKTEEDAPLYDRYVFFDLGMGPKDTLSFLGSVEFPATNYQLEIMYNNGVAMTLPQGGSSYSLVKLVSDGALHPALLAAREGGTTYSRLQYLGRGSEGLIGGIRQDEGGSGKPPYTAVYMITPEKFITLPLPLPKEHGTEFIQYHEFHGRYLAWIRNNRNSLTLYTRAPQGSWEPFPIELANIWWIDGTLYLIPNNRTQEIWEYNLSEGSGTT